MRVIIKLPACVPTSIRCVQNFGGDQMPQTMRSTERMVEFFVTTKIMGNSVLETWEDIATDNWIPHGTGSKRVIIPDSLKGNYVVSIVSIQASKGMKPTDCKRLFR